METYIHDIFSKTLNHPYNSFIDAFVRVPDAIIVLNDDSTFLPHTGGEKKIKLSLKWYAHIDLLINNYIYDHTSYSLNFEIARQKFRSSMIPNSDGILSKVDVSKITPFHDIYTYPSRYSTLMSKIATYDMLSKLYPYLMPLCTYRLSIDSFHKAKQDLKLIYALTVLKLLPVSNDITMEPIIMMLDPVKILKEIFMYSTEVYISETYEWDINLLLTGNVYIPVARTFEDSDTDTINDPGLCFTDIRHNILGRFKNTKDTTLVKDGILKIKSKLYCIKGTCPICMDDKKIKKMDCCYNYTCQDCVKEAIAKNGACTHCSASII